MLEQIRAFSEWSARRKPSAKPDANSDPDVAAVALFFHVIGADGVVDEVESEKLKSMIIQEYGDSGADLRELIEAGEEADREAVDLYLHQHPQPLARARSEGSLHRAFVASPMRTDIGMNSRTTWSGGLPT
jgi:uncharacterized tellurite resistance protein B-like protein